MTFHFKTDIIALWFSFPMQKLEIESQLLLPDSDENVLCNQINKEIKHMKIQHVIK